jgi:hypothetical protein
MAVGLIFSVGACTNPLAPRTSNETDQEEKTPDPGDDEGTAFVLPGGQAVIFA